MTNIRWQQATRRELVLGTLAAAGVTGLARLAAATPAKRSPEVRITDIESFQVQVPAVLLFGCPKDIIIGLLFPMGKGLCRLTV